MQVLSRMIIEFLSLLDPNMGAHLLALGLEHNLAEMSRSLITCPFISIAVFLVT